MRCQAIFNGKQPFGNGVLRIIIGRPTLPRRVNTGNKQGQNQRMAKKNMQIIALLVLQVTGRLINKIKKKANFTVEDTFYCELTCRRNVDSCRLWDPRFEDLYQGGSIMMHFYQ